MKKRILVVDDDGAILELLRAKLSKRGFEVSTAQNEREFWNLAFHEKRPDLLILDIWLSTAGGGTRIYDEALRSGFDPTIPVIFITALIDDRQPPKRAPDGGRFALYGKPFDFELMLEDIQKMTHPPVYQEPLVNTIKKNSRIPERKLKNHNYHEE